jgi:hypothetical protein
VDVMTLLTRHRAASVAAAIVTALPSLCAAPVAANAQPDAPVLTCTNPASGATWQISIDYGRATVDTNPAQFGDGEISWHDAKDGGTYTLDRRSGDLTVVVASSTGGYFLHDHCRPPP